MPAEVLDHISVTDILERFGVPIPSGLAIIPDNLASAESIRDLRQQAEADTVRTLLKANNIEYIEIFDGDHQPPYVQQYNFEWFGPTLFVSAGLLSQNPQILSVTLGIISNYLYDLFKGIKGSKASINIIYQQDDGSCKKIHYEGPPDGLKEVSEIIKTLEGK